VEESTLKRYTTVNEIIDIVAIGVIMMILIVAVDRQWGIGYDGQLLDRIPADMKHFKEKTMGKVVVMGRETFESLPGRKPLKDRINIVLTKGDKITDKGIILCNSLLTLFSALSRYNSDDIFVIGGESIYKQLMPYCSKAYITKIDKVYIADTYFPNIDKEHKWQCIEEGMLQRDQDVAFKFTIYQNKNVREWNPIKKE
jgi:dihydrofolate reductase